MVMGPPGDRAATYILVDFCNLYNRELQSDALDNAWVKCALNEIVGLAIKAASETDDLKVRLYGGWIENGTDTKHASLLMGGGDIQSFFPIVRSPGGSILRGNIELARTILCAPAATWFSTQKVRKDIPRLILSPEFRAAGCSETRDECLFRRIAHVTRRNRRCPKSNCGFRTGEVFMTTEQKMVDTMMACDILHLATGTERCTIIMVTDDTDIIPALVMAGTTNQYGHRMVWIVRNGQHEQQYRALLKTAGLEVQVWRV
jgi:hypothetical protein